MMYACVPYIYYFFGYAKKCSVHLLFRNCLHFIEFYHGFTFSFFISKVFFAIPYPKCPPFVPKICCNIYCIQHILNIY